MEQAVNEQKEKQMRAAVKLVRVMAGIFFIFAMMLYFDFTGFAASMFGGTKNIIATLFLIIAMVDLFILPRLLMAKFEQRT